MFTKYSVPKEAAWLGSLGAGVVIWRSQIQTLHPAATSWICSQSSKVQILGHTLCIANWSVFCQLGFLTMLCSIKMFGSSVSVSGMSVIYRSYLKAKCMTTIKRQLHFFLPFVLYFLLLSGFHSLGDPTVKKYNQNSCDFKDWVQSTPLDTEPLTSFVLFTNSFSISSYLGTLWKRMKQMSVN